ncbi:MAG: glutaredoxin domain-containing protein [Leifsonia sp.]
MSESVKVYELAGCQQCRMTKVKLDEEGVSYTVVNLSEDESALAHIKALGHLQAPVVETTTASWAGFRPDLIKALAKTIALEEYDVPTDPMDDLGCDSCQ